MDTTLNVVLNWISLFLMDTFLSQCRIRRWDPWNPVLQAERSIQGKSAEELLSALDCMHIMDQSILGQIVQGAVTK